jgi:hypothetical protein
MCPGDRGVTRVKRRERGVKAERKREEGKRALMSGNLYM